MTRFPELHDLLTGVDTPADQEVRRLQQERLSLLPRQIGRPGNRERMRALTTAQLRLEAGA